MRVDAAAPVTTAASPARRRRGLSEATRDRILSVASPIALFVLWQIAAQAHLIDVRFFPAPSSIAGTFGTLIANGTLLSNTLTTLERLAIGIVVGGVPALLIGLAMGLYRPVYAIVDPLISATYPVPKSAILPLILLVFGLGEPSKIAMVAIGMFYPVVINTAAGVREINRIYFDVGHNFGARGWAVFRTIAFPGALPVIMTGVKLGAGLGLILIAIAEMVGAQSGLGFMIWNAWQILQVNVMYVGLITIAIIGFVMTVLLNELERFLIPSRTRR
ncbi:MAG TPA: ABC transporter permease [Candidatus Elarobacter sp.]|jgi:NitT/TauT family transport system permease protein|nr:ABC transporter permease [Candidatus Elarobacter sp.]